MKIETLKLKTRSLTRVLLAVAALLGVLIFLKIEFFVSASNAMSAAQVDPSKPGTDETNKALAQTRACANEIKKKNLFVPAAARQNPVNEVIGILGAEALIGDKWYKVGDSVGDAKIVAVEPTKVKVAWDGQEKEFFPIGASNSEGRGGPAAQGSGPQGAGSRRGRGAQAAGLSAEERQKLRERLANASPEEKQRLMEQRRQRGGARGQ